MSFIAQKISQTRKTKGLTQEELAEQSKVNLRTIQRIENCENAPRGKTLHLICDVLEIDLQDLLTNDNMPGKSSIGNKLVNGLFLMALNLVLMGIIGFLTLDVNANTNSRFGGFLLSFLLPFFIVILTKNITGLERMLKFGFGYIAYFVLIMMAHGFPIGFATGLFPCVLISLSVLYFGSELIKIKEK